MESAHSQHVPPHASELWSACWLCATPSSLCRLQSNLLFLRLISSSCFSLCPHHAVLNHHLAIPHFASGLNDGLMVTVVSGPHHPLRLVSPQVTSTFITVIPHTRQMSQVCGSLISQSLLLFPQIVMNSTNSLPWTWCCGY